MSPRQVDRAAHQAGWLFIAAGAIGLVYDVMPGSVEGGVLGTIPDVVNLSVGLLAAFVIPWHRLPHQLSLVLPLFALLNLGVSGYSGTMPEATYGVWYVLVFVWLGQWQSTRTVLFMSPFAAVAYTVPFLLGAPGDPGAAGTVAISIPVAVVVGYAIARMQAEVRRAQAGQAEAIEALARASVTDDLTGLGNRRAANTLLDTLNPGDALAILDLDHFKDVNDTLGHQRGDEVLHAFGMFLRDAVRGHDTVARLGGEEFVVVLDQAGDAGVTTVERLLEAWRATGPTVTFSAGIAIHRAGTAPTDTFGHADNAPYEAKSTGRNRVIAFGHHAAAEPPDLRAS